MISSEYVFRAYLQSSAESDSSKTLLPHFKLSLSARIEGIVASIWILTTEIMNTRVIQVVQNFKIAIGIMS